jgi:hypothetical protein
MKTTFHVPPLMWNQFKKAMLAAKRKNEEVIGFFFCRRHKLSKRHSRYVPATWIVPGPDCYEYQSAGGLVLKQQFHLYLLENLLEPGLDIVHVHTHPGKNAPHFSTVDDCHESEYARFLATAIKHKPRLISGIFDESLDQPNFRLWNRRGTDVKPVEFYRSWFEVPEATPTEGETELMFDRQTVFGDKFQRQLGEMTVTLVGCGGIGAVFAEQLGRLGVKKWVLVDSDRLETTNLNRMPGATWEMAEQKLPKVEYVKKLIKQIYPTGSQVRAVPENVESETAQTEIGPSDLIVVATDNHHSRQIAQELALTHSRPLLSLGTHIDIAPDGKPRMYCRVTVPPLGGNWCLMCGNIINLQQAALEVAPRNIQQLANQRGYLQGINNPAVFWLNSICASTGVGVVQGMLSGYLDIERGLDWIYQFPESQWRKTDTDYLMSSGCYFCGTD